MARKTNLKTIKRTIKFLATVKDPHLVKQIIKSAPDAVVKQICNIALNAAAGDIRLSAPLKRVLSKNRRSINALIDKKKPISSKRATLQRGGGAFIPILISTLLGTLGPILFKALKK